MDYIQKMDDFIFSEDNFNKAIESLLIHSKNKTRFRKNPFHVSTGGIDSSDYTSKSLRRSKFSQKNFVQTIFKNSGSAGSIFSSCQFDKCQFVNANFQECTFSGGNISNNTNEIPITNSNFNHSLFTNNFEINDVYFQHCVFQGTAFIDCAIKNSKFFSSTLEDTLFSNVCLEKVRFSDLNIDYSEFENVKMHQVILPFSQICFSFGLLPYLLKTDDTVYVTSSNSKDGYISKEDYLKLIPDFIQFYKGVNDFFPLANIFLSLGNRECAKESIMNGILTAITNFDFIRIKYLCKLIYSYPVFSYHERKLIYDYINSHICFYDTDSRLQYNYSLYKSEINNYLLNKNKADILTSEINIITEITYDNGNLLGQTLSILEELIEYRKSKVGEHNISIRHNSNVEILVFLQDLYQSLAIIVPAIYSVFLGIEILKEKKTTNKQRRLELQYEKSLKSIEIENAQIELERNRIGLEKEKLELENQLIQRLQNQEELRQNIIDSNINISEIHHITYGNIPPDVNENIIQFWS